MQEDMMRSCTLLRLLLLLLVPGLMRKALLDGAASCTAVVAGEAACLPLPPTGAALCAD
jgi:hypothetical protein